MANNAWSIEVGLNNVPAYQASGRPFASGGIDTLGAGSTGPTKVSFPYVSRWIYIVNRSGEDVRVGFSELGVVGTNYFIVSRKNSDTRHSSARLEVKVSDLWLSGSGLVDVCAGLTSIPRDRTSMGTGLPSWSGSNGVG